jgi:ribonuclease HI
MDQQGGIIKLHWVPRHVNITSNENADTKAKEALNERIKSRETSRGA